MAQAVFVMMGGKDSIVNLVVVKLGMYFNPDDVKYFEKYCGYNKWIICVFLCYQQDWLVGYVQQPILFIRVILFYFFSWC